MLPHQVAQAGGVHPAFLRLQLREAVVRGEVEHHRGVTEGEVEKRDALSGRARQRHRQVDGDCGLAHPLLAPADGDHAREMAAIAAGRPIRGEELPLDGRHLGNRISEGVEVHRRGEALLRARAHRAAQVVRSVLTAKHNDTRAPRGRGHLERCVERVELGRLPVNQEHIGAHPHDALEDLHGIMHLAHHPDDSLGGVYVV